MTIIIINTDISKNIATSDSLHDTSDVSRDYEITGAIIRIPDKESLC